MSKGSVRRGMCGRDGQADSAGDTVTVTSTGGSVVFGNPTDGPTPTVP